MAATYFTQFRLQNIAVGDKTLFRRIENYHTRETSSSYQEGKRRWGREDDQGDDEKEGKQGDPEYFLIAVHK